MAGGAAVTGGGAGGAARRTRRFGGRARSDGGAKASPVATRAGGAGAAGAAGAATRRHVPATRSKPSGQRSASSSRRVAIAPVVRRLASWLVDCDRSVNAWLARAAL